MSSETILKKREVVKSCSETGTTRGQDLFETPSYYFPWSRQGNRTNDLTSSARPNLDFNLTCNFIVSVVLTHFRGLINKYPYNAQIIRFFTLVAYCICFYMSSIHVYDMSVATYRCTCIPTLYIQVYVDLYVRAIHLVRTHRRGVEVKRFAYANVLFS